MSRSPRRLSGLPLYLIGVLALVLAMGGAATAGSMITGKQIKDSTVTTNDVKDGSLLLKDLKKSDVAKLKGTNGTNGTNGTDGTDGAAGASAFAPPPSGTVIKGGGRLDGDVSAAGISLYSYAPLPFTTAVTLDDDGAGRNLYLGPSALAGFGEASASSCPGSFAAPTALSGMLCVYLATPDNVANTTSIVFSGAQGGADAAEHTGLFVSANSSAAGKMNLPYVWVYTAP